VPADDVGTGGVCGVGGDGGDEDVAGGEQER
jgi:hypothetical protein